MRLSRLSLALAVYATPTAAWAQVQLDLGSEQGDKIPGQLPGPGTFRVLILNKLPGEMYQYIVHGFVVDQPISPITLPQFKETKAGGNEGFAACADEDKARVAKAKTALHDAQDEATLTDPLKEANAIYKAGDKYGSCEGFEDLRALRLATEAVTDSYTVHRGQNLIVTVTRTAEGQPAKSWTKTFVGPSKGEWITTYGFSFVIDGFAPSATYTAEEDGNGGFVIQQDRTREHLKFVPSFFFTFVPSGPQNLRPAASGGLGFDLSNPIVFLAPGLVWNRNLTLHVGLAAAKVDRLLGRYQEGQIVATTLTPEQLRQQVYRLNPFVSVSFNFTSNPFAGTKAGAANASTESTSSQ